jgi:predicted esterase
MNAWRALLLIPLGCQQGHRATRTQPTATTAEAVPSSALTAPALAGSAAPPATAASEASQEPPWPPAPPPGVSSDFCIELVSALDEETCYVLPDAPTKDLLLYLHGIVPPGRESAVKTNFETVVASASKRAGVAALIPRGRQGLAPKGHPGWWGWPTSAEGYARLAPELVESFVTKRNALEELVGRRFERWFVAGSSSGAYFIAALALNGGIDADGFGAMSGGALSARADFTKLSPKPFYIGYGTRDSVGPGARALGERLKQAGWPVLVSAHPVGHGAKEVYLDEAFAFWREPRR